MKPPFSYYGGKQKLVRTILPLIPDHNLYGEPFIGGGAVFWGKAPSNVEVINDTNRELINFYEVLKHDFVSLEKEIAISLHSRDLHRKAWVTYTNPDMFTPIKRAWAVWMLANQGFASKIDGPWGYDVKQPQTSKKIRNRREGFTIDYAIRMQDVQLECTDALRVIRSRDRADSFFYCDPPYYNSDCGHYDGYTIEDFEMLLRALGACEGRFMLSSYPSDILSDYTKQHGWHTLEIEQSVTVARKKTDRKRKVEVITLNYDVAA